MEVVLKSFIFAGEEWGKKRKAGAKRRKKKVVSESDDGSMSSDDSEPKNKRSKKQKETGFTKPLKLSEDLEAILGTNKAPRPVSICFLDLLFLGSEASEESKPSSDLDTTFFLRLLLPDFIIKIYIHLFNFHLSIEII